MVQNLRRYWDDEEKSVYYSNNGTLELLTDQPSLSHFPEIIDEAHTGSWILDQEVYKEIRVPEIHQELKAIDIEYGTRSWREYALASSFLHLEAKVKLEEAETQAQSLRDELITLIS
jgi:hypothetical protein